MQYPDQLVSRACCMLQCFLSTVMRAGQRMTAQQKSYS